MILLFIGGLPFIPVISILALIICAFHVRNIFSPFVIDEKGITSKWPGRNIFIAWNEMEYVGVGELFVHGRLRYYNLTLCFSKSHLDYVYFRQSYIWNVKKQNAERFFINYRAGMLEEVLKYVDEARIKDVERIKDDPDAHRMKWFSTSVGRQQKGPHDWKQERWNKW